MKIKEIRWIKKVGYQIVERELGKEFVKEFVTRQEDGEHCPTAEPVEGWAVCRFENGVYHLIKKF